MSSNVTGEKKHRTSTSSPNNNSNSTPSLNNSNSHPLLPDFASQLSAPINTSPLLLVAAMASAWQNANPAIFQRLQQHIRLQQEQQAVSQKEEKPRVESKKTKRKVDDNERSSKVNSPRSQSSWLPATSPTQQSATHKVRKLKLYSADEKIDIIDYAKVIGNRAAGREFNVAESSIREWRKNEDRLRKQSESASTGNQRVEFNHMDIIEKLDDLLVDYVESNTDVSWYDIRDQAQDLYPKVIKGSALDGSPDSEMQITMGWVTRFMKRNESRVRRIAPPVIATANSANNHNGSVSMVRKEPSFGNGSATDAHSEKTTIASSHTNSTNPSPTSSPSPAITNSRRKCAQPRRVENATLLLTPETEKPPSIEKDNDEPAKKRAKSVDAEENESKEAGEQLNEESDSSIKVY